ncbi:hypothetical protein DYB35_010052 [Aphanomyces astaci]|uniref:DUF7769 domain-containing protein n=1 Tax=Aphanomyces astaci TaxID=112090 RepID=A0A418CLR3_APHAT|nr:hypothetical protein DYB35_010052 [Aphanomyces astaci]
MRAKKKDLTKNDREAILQQLMAHLVDNKKLIRGALNKIALDFGVHRGTVQRVWKRANVDLDNKLRPCSDVSSRKKGHSGRNLKHEDVANRLKAVVECGFQQLDESDVNAKFDQLAVEVSEAMEMSEFSSQLEKLIVNDELKEDAGVELDELLDLCSLL